MFSSSTEVTNKLNGTNPSESLALQKKSSWSETEQAGPCGRLSKTLCIYFISFGVGMAAAVTGITFIHTRLLYGVTTAEMAMVLTFESIGRISGVLLCGTLIRRVKVEFLCICGSAFLFFPTCIAPFFTMFAAFVTMVTIRGCGAGLYAVASQSYCIDAWNGHRYKSTVTQCLHAVWSIGATVSPFIIQLFLVEISPTINHLNTTASLRTYSLAENSFNNFSRVFHNDSSSYRSENYSSEIDNHVTNALKSLSSFNLSVDTDIPHPEGLQKVRYAYVVVGLLSLITVFPMTVVYFYANGNTPMYCLTANLQAKPQCQDLTKNGRPHIRMRLRQIWEHISCFTVSSAFLVFSIGFLYGGLEVTTRSFFPSFVVRNFDWPVHDATLLVSAFYGAFCTGRLLAVPLSVLLSPSFILIFNILFVITGISLFLLLDLVVHLSPVIIWISAVLIGLGLSSSFACIVIVLSPAAEISSNQQKMLSSTSTVLSLLSTGCATGIVLFPVLIGILFDRLSAMWMIYVLFGTAFCLSFLLIVRRILVQRTQ